MCLIKKINNTIYKHILFNLLLYILFKNTKLIKKFIIYLIYVKLDLNNYNRVIFI